MVAWLAVRSAREGKMREAMDNMAAIVASGYATSDIIQTLFKVARTADIPETEKLEILRVIGFSHMRISEGLNTHLQLQGCLARICALAHKKNAGR